MKFTEFFFRQGEDMQRPLQSAEADSFPDGEAAKRGLSIKRLFDEKMLDCCSAAPHHLALQGASPRGEAAKRLTIFALLCASTMRQGEALEREKI